MTRARLPLAPLVAQLDLALGPRPDVTGRAAEQHDGQRDRLAHACGVTPRHAQRFIAAGALPWYLADKAAVSIGLLPVLLWPDEWPALDNIDPHHHLTQRSNP